MNKKLIQKRRTMKYFINATYKLMKEKKVSDITIREIADVAGYNSATMYNYFDSLDHLIFYTSLKYLQDYMKDVANIIDKINDSLEIYFLIWEKFCYHSFLNPEIYNCIFFGKYSNSLNNDIKEYYCIFPEELGKQYEHVKTMLLGRNIYERNLALLKNCAREEKINRKNINELNEMTILIYHGMLCEILNKFRSYDLDESVEKTIKYIKQAFISYEGNIFINTIGAST